MWLAEVGVQIPAGNPAVIVSVARCAQEGMRHLVDWFPLVRDHGVLRARVDSGAGRLSRPGLMARAVGFFRPTGRTARGAVPVVGGPSAGRPTPLVTGGA